MPSPKIVALSLAILLALPAAPAVLGGSSRFEVQLSDDIRKVPKDKEKEKEKEKPKEDDSKEKEKPDEKPKEPDPPKKNCRKVPYICGSKKECFDGNNSNCVDKPVWCTREECD